MSIVNTVHVIWVCCQEDCSSWWRLHCWNKLVL